MLRLTVGLEPQPPAIELRATVDGASARAGLAVADLERIGSWLPASRATPDDGSLALVDDHVLLRTTSGTLIVSIDGVHTTVFWRAFRDACLHGVGLIRVGPEHAGDVPPRRYS